MSKVSRTKENVSNRVRYTASDVNKNRFYQMPKFLFEGEFKQLSNDARVLYSLLRDRHDLSLSNNWINENNEVYLIFTRENMADMLGCTQPTLRKSIEQLIKLGLMEEERMGLNKANRIYLTAVSIDTTGLKNSFIPECKNLSVKSEEIFQSREKESFSQECKNLSPNDTDLTYTDSKDTDNQSINQDNLIGLVDFEENYENYRALISKNIEYDYLKQYSFKNDDLIDNVFELILEVVTSKKASIRISGENKPLSLVKSTFLKLNSAHIEYAIDNFQKNTVKATNVKAYLLTVLYNAPMTMSAYYTNLVKHELYKIAE